MQRERNLDELINECAKLRTDEERQIFIEGLSARERQLLSDAGTSLVDALRPAWETFIAINEGLQRLIEWLGEWRSTWPPELSAITLEEAAKQRAINRRRCAAFHEAGHAVVGNKFGLAITRLSIEPSLIGKWWRVPARCDFADMSLQLSEEAVMLVAGVVCTKLFLGKNERFYSSQDGQDFKRVAASLDKPEDLLIDDASELAERIIQERRPVVVALVNALMEHRDLNGPDVARIIDKALAHQ